MKKLIFALTLFLFIPGIQAKVITPDEALKRISDISVYTRSSSLELRHTYLTESGQPAIYIFDNNDNGGAMIVSANDRAFPLLGYMDSGNFNADGIPPQLKWWIEQYSAQIEYASSHDIMLPTTATTKREAVAPLLKTTWNQTSPYDLLTPEINGQHTPTGCVATAMAQVMNYWKYPEIATGSVSITLPDGKNSIMNLREKPFDWDNMLNSYIKGNYSEKQADAVAYLMKACGYASNMSYSLEGSGAVSMVSATALFKNFKYNPSIQYFSRNYISAEDWEEIIYNELANRRPVMYGGQSTSVGHEFVCDGYDGGGYFHFNWGWGGMSDGYFLLNALNPYAVGTGGGQGGGYNFNQDIIVGIQPEQSATFSINLSQFGNLSVSSDRDVFTLKATGGGWYNTGVQQAVLDFGVEIKSLQDDKLRPIYITLKSDKINPPTLTKKADGTYVEYHGIATGQTFSMPSELTDGRYRLTVCVQSDKDESQWIPVNTTGEAYNYIYFVKAGKEYNIENMEDASLSMIDAEIVSPLYYGCATKIRISVRNNSEKDLTNAFYPILSTSGSNQMLGEGLVMTVPAGETKNEDFTTVFELLQGASAPSSRRNYILKFINPSDETYAKDENGMEWEKKITMNINFSSPDVSCSDLDMPGLSSVEKDVENLGTASVFRVYDKNAIKFTCTITNNRGFFGYPVYGLIYESDNLRGNIDMVELSPTPALAEGESKQLEGTLDFSAGTYNKTYVVFPFALIDNSFKSLEQGKNWCFEIASSGVDMAFDEQNAPEIFFDKTDNRIIASGTTILKLINMEGRTVKTIESGTEINISTDLKNIHHGIYIVIAIGQNGKTKSMKLAL